MTWPTAIWRCQPVIFCHHLTNEFEGRLGTVTTCDERLLLPLRQRHATRYMQAGLVLVGDAAHTIHPLAGQGVNLGFLDVATLAAVLTNAKHKHTNLGDVRILSRYQKQRQPDNLRMMALMQSLVWLFGSQRGDLRWLRNTGMKMIQTLPAIKHYLMQEAMGTGGNIPPLCVHKD